MDKNAALAFLKRFENNLSRKLPNWKEVHKTVLNTSKDANERSDQPHLRGPEQAFLNHYVLPELHAFLSVEPSMNADSAREVILSENSRWMKQESSGTPARTERHPFTKALGTNAQKIYQKWQGDSPLVQSCPDFAIQSPFPHKILFEGKYFSGEKSPETAQRDLVTDLYQAFFYLGMPSVPGTEKRPPWDYDYACLLAYDASVEGTLLSAWRALPQNVRNGFWDGANIYVMILRGTTINIDELEINREWLKILADRKRVCRNCESPVQEDDLECKQCGMSLKKR